MSDAFLNEASTAVEVVAHRGFSGPEPEQTRAAYVAAIDLARRREVPITLECDVHLSADDELICLHDLDLARTAGRSAAARDLTVGQLKDVDFGCWHTPEPTAAQRELITLNELFELVAAARAEGVDVSVAVETKHPNPAGLDVEQHLRTLLTAYGWLGEDPAAADFQSIGAAAPVRLITFYDRAIAAFDGTGLRRSWLVDDPVANPGGGGLDVSDGSLPPAAAGADAIGASLRLLKADPDYARRVTAGGHAPHVWTANEPADIHHCLDLGVGAVTSNWPDRVFDVLAQRR